MANKTAELLVLERIASSLEELVTLNKKVLKELRDDEPASVAAPRTQRSGVGASLARK